MGVCSIGSDIESIANRFPKVFSGVGKLSGFQLKLHIDREVTPVAQKPRRIPYPLKDKVQSKIDELLDLDIIEKVSVHQPGSAQLCLRPSLTKMTCGYVLT